VVLVGLNRAVRKRAANQGGTGSADDAILGWHSLLQLSHWATQVTLLKITIPPDTALPWHRHPVISVAYVLSGHLTVEKRDTGERRILEPGQALAETVETTHRGFTTDEPVELIVFYAGQSGLPLTINQE